MQKGWNQTTVEVGQAVIGKGDYRGVTFVVESINGSTCDVKVIGSIKPHWKTSDRLSVAIWWLEGN
jgi:hypothetical protein